MRIGTILTILLFFITHFTSGQWIQYNTGNTRGIQSSFVSSCLEDQNNNLWFGTDQGVTCFNRNLGTWTLFNTSNGLLNSFIYQVFEDKQGAIWVTTNGGGISRYKNQMWSNYTVKEGLSYNVVRAVAQTPDGTLWFGTYGRGICSYHPESGFKKITTDGIADSYVLSLLALSDTVLLVGTLNTGLIVFHNKVTPTISQGPQLTGKKIFSLFRDHSGAVWIGTDQGVQQYDLSTNSVSPCPDSLEGNAVYAVCEKEANELQFAAANRLYKFSKGSWSSFIPDNLSQPASFYSVFYDTDGNGWFGSSNQGLFRYSGETWYNYCNSTGLNDYNFTDLCEDIKHNLWFSSYSDIYRFDGQNWTSMAKATGIANSYFRHIISDPAGNIWCISEYNGVYKYDGSGWTFFSRDTYFKSSYVISIAVDQEGNIWAGTSYMGIFRYDGTSWTSYSTDQGLASNYIAAIAFLTDGKMVVSSDYSQLSYFDGTNWTVDNTITGNYYISDMAVDSKDNIWLATSNGIVKYKGTDIQEYFRDPFYYWNNFPFISEDKKGHIWACNENLGLLRFDGVNWYTYSTSDGLSSNYLSNILFDSRGRIWLTSNNGINMSEYVTYIPERESDPVEGIMAFPNPFSSVLDLRFFSGNAGNAAVQILSTDGRLLKQFNEKIETGNNVLHFESSGWPDGFLFCSITLNGSTRHVKLLKISTR
jgi:ligand-binding sensor domain-containing protein